MPIVPLHLQFDIIEPVHKKKPVYLKQIPELAPCRISNLEDCLGIHGHQKKHFMFDLSRKKASFFRWRWYNIQFRRQI